MDEKDEYFTLTTTTVKGRASEDSSATASSLRARKELAKAAPRPLPRQRQLPQIHLRRYQNQERNSDHFRRLGRCGHGPLIVAIDPRGAAADGPVTTKHYCLGKTEIARRSTPQLHFLRGLVRALRPGKEFKTTSITWISCDALMTSRNFEQITPNGLRGE